MQHHKIGDQQLCKRTCSVLLHAVTSALNIGVRHLPQVL